MCCYLPCTKFLMQLKIITAYNLIRSHIIIVQHIIQIDFNDDDDDKYYKYGPQSVFENSYYDLYYGRSITTDQIMLCLTKPSKNRCGNSKQWQPLQHHCREAPEINRPEGRANKNMATECSVYSTISLIWNGDYPTKLHNSLKLLNFHLGLYILMPKAVILKTCHMVRKFLA
jgi:hypothetical protein